MIKLADRITNLQPPPGHWNDEKIALYKEGTELIHKELASASEYLGERLRVRLMGMVNDKSCRYTAEVIRGRAMTNKLKHKPIPYLFGVLVMLLSTISCAPVYRLQDDKINESAPFNLIDNRPEIEKTYRPTLSGKEIPGQPVVHKFGDKNFKPDRMEAFKKYLEKHLTNALTDKTITVYKFEVSAIMDPVGIKMDQQRVLGIGSSRGAKGILLAGLIGEHIDHGNQPTDRFFLCEIEGGIDGKSFAVMAMEYFSGVFDYGSAKKDMYEVVYKAFSKVVQAID